MSDVSASASAPIPILSPYLIVRNAESAIRFYVEAFGATEKMRLTSPDGTIGHAELAIGNSFFMLADEHPDFGAVGPATLGGSPVQLHLRVDDVDAVVNRAVAAGAVILRKVEDQFHGNRSGMIADPFGHCWFVLTAIEQLSEAEVERRWNTAMSGEPA